MRDDRPRPTRSRTAWPTRSATAGATPTVGSSSGPRTWSRPGPGGDPRGDPDDLRGLRGASRHHLILRIAADRRLGARPDPARRGDARPGPARRAGGRADAASAGASRSRWSPPQRLAVLLHRRARLPDPATGPPTRDAPPAPERPTTSLPCLSFCWEIVAPEPWAVARSGPGLVARPTRSPASVGRLARRLVAWRDGRPVGPDARGRDAPRARRGCGRPGPRRSPWANGSPAGIRGPGRW